MMDKSDKTENDSIADRYDAYTTEITPQFLADLRHLVSIAVWIRSEQMAQRDVQRLIRTVDPATWDSIPTPLTFIDTRQLVLGDCADDQANGILMWNKLDAMLDIFGAKALKSSWRK